MSRKGCRHRGFQGSLMLVRAGLVLSMTARAQQPVRARATPGQDNGDSTQVSAERRSADAGGAAECGAGDVSVEPASVNQFSPAEVNYPLTTGDRLWTDYNALAEVEGGQLAVRMAQTTDLTVTAMTDTLAQFGLGQGSVHLRAYALEPGRRRSWTRRTLRVTVLAAGDVRVDVDPSGECDEW